MAAESRLVDGASADTTCVQPFGTLSTADGADNVSTFQSVETRVRWAAGPRGLRWKSQQSGARQSQRADAAEAGGGWFFAAVPCLPGTYCGTRPAWVRNHWPRHQTHGSPASWLELDPHAMGCSKIIWLLCFRSSRLSTKLSALDRPNTGQLTGSAESLSKPYESAWALLCHPAHLDC